MTCKVFILFIYFMFVDECRLEYMGVLEKNKLENYVIFRGKRFGDIRM